MDIGNAARIAEPEWIVQNFQHGTLNFDRQTHNVIRVIDGVDLVTEGVVTLSKVLTYAKDFLDSARLAPDWAVGRVGGALC